MTAASLKHNKNIPCYCSRILSCANVNAIYRQFPNTFIIRNLPQIIFKNGDNWIQTKKILFSGLLSIRRWDQFNGRHLSIFISWTSPDMYPSSYLFILWLLRIWRCWLRRDVNGRLQTLLIWTSRGHPGMKNVFLMNVHLRFRKSRTQSAPHRCTSLVASLAALPPVMLLIIGLMDANVDSCLVTEASRER